MATIFSFTIFANNHSFINNLLSALPFAPSYSGCGGTNSLGIRAVNSPEELLAHQRLDAQINLHNRCLMRVLLQNARW